MKVTYLIFCDLYRKKETLTLFSIALQIGHKLLHNGKEILIQTETACTQVNHIHSCERQLFLIYLRLTPIIRSSICTIRGDTHTNLEQRQMKTIMTSLLIKILPKNSRFLINWFTHLISIIHDQCGR